MQPNLCVLEWLVERAACERQASEWRAQPRAEHDIAVLPPVMPPQLANRYRRAIGRLLVSMGGSLDRYGSAEAWRPTPGAQTGAK